MTTKLPSGKLLSLRGQIQWEAKAERLLNKRYGIGLDDCTADGHPTAAQLDQTPEEFVDWVGGKYGLFELE